MKKEVGFSTWQPPTPCSTIMRDEFVGGGVGATRPISLDGPQGDWFHGFLCSHVVAGARLRFGPEIGQQGALLGQMADHEDRVSVIPRKRGVGDHDVIAVR